MKRCLIPLFIVIVLVGFGWWYLPPLKFAYYSIIGVPIDDPSIVRLKRVYTVTPNNSPLTIEVGPEEQWTAINVMIDPIDPETGIPTEGGLCRDFTWHGPQKLKVSYLTSEGVVEIRSRATTLSEVGMLDPYINHYYFQNPRCRWKAFKVILLDFKWRTVELVHRVGMLVEMLMRLKIKIQIEFE